MTVLAQHSALAQHLEGPVLTQHRLGEKFRELAQLPVEKKRHNEQTEGCNGLSKRPMKLPS